uniref:Signal recognition particle-docking protein FtsY n=1 Tax=Panagrellus redivivus TaxID=6233 RepID=A0A7E4WCP5_PANRE
MAQQGGGGFWGRLFGRKHNQPSESKVAVTPPKPADEPLYDNIDILEKSALNAPPPPASPPAAKDPIKEAPKEAKKDTGASTKEVRKTDHGPAKKPETKAPTPATSPAAKADPSKLTPANTAPAAQKSKELINQPTMQISLQQDMSAAPQSVGQEIVSKDPNIVTNYKAAPVVSTMSVPPKPIRQKLSEPASSGGASTCKSAVTTS